MLLIFIRNFPLTLGSIDGPNRFRDTTPVNRPPARTPQPQVERHEHVEDHEDHDIHQLVRDFRATSSANVESVLGRRLSDEMTRLLAKSDAGLRFGAND